MRRFIINILIFCGLIVFIAVGLVILSEFCIKSRKSQLLRLRENITVVFSGDSNVECSVNDEIITNSINISTSGEAYLYSYSKIKAILEHNNQIKIVFLSYSPGKLTKYIEERWLYSDEYIIEKTRYYNYVLDKTEKRFLFKKNPKAYLKGTFQSVVFNFSGFFKSLNIRSPRKGILNFGGYKKMEINKLQSDIDRQKNIDMNDSEMILQKKWGYVQESYLMKISNLCKNKSAKLFLLKTPKYQREFKNDSIISESDILKFHNFLPSDSILDMSNFYLPDSCYADINHLNYKGAKIFSEYMNNLIHSEQIKLKQITPYN